MPKERTEEAKRLIKKSRLSERRVAEGMMSKGLVRFKTPETLNYHFNKKEDISIELLDKIKSFLSQPYIKDSNVDGRDNIGDSNIIFNNENHKKEIEILKAEIERLKDELTYFKDLVKNLSTK